MSDHQQRQSEAPSPRHGQFALRHLMMVMLVISVVSAVFGGLMQGGTQRVVFIVYGVAAPVGLMIVLSFWIWLRDRWRK